MVEKDDMVKTLENLGLFRSSFYRPGPEPFRVDESGTPVAVTVTVTTPSGSWEGELLLVNVKKVDRG